MGLRSYRRKRNFRQTPEPPGSTHATPQGRSYLIQKHAARRLHYDFRLELNGVLVSWAIPKGPSFNPKERRLAVHVEDHPVEYGDFEGVIPKGQYGGGTVLLWDRGRWIEQGDPVAGLRKGKLKFRLEGEKLRGGWTLVRIRASDSNGDKENWLLIKEDDDEADPSGSKDRDLYEEAESVATGRTMEQISAARDREWQSHRLADEKGGTVRQLKQRIDPAGLPGARRSGLPDRVSPELATLVKEVPKGDDWLHEIKYDGYRILCRIENGQALLFTREGKDWTSRFGGLARAAALFPVQQALLDGEVVVLEPDGTTSFQALQNVLNRREHEKLAYFVFDLLHLDGFDLTRVPLLARKEGLAAFFHSDARNPLRYGDHVLGHGEALYREACQHSLEGVISKRASSPYHSGRKRDWLKIKCVQGQEFVIGGFTEPSGSRTGLGALLLGVHDRSGKLVFTGGVGTGFSDELLKDLRARLDRIEQKTPPFSSPPTGSAARRAHWVQPRLVAEVEFTGWTRDGMLRHPSFKSLREDKAASKVVRELPSPNDAGAKAPAAGRSDGTEISGVRISHPDRVLYPADGITKIELARYYEAMAPRILPHLKDRPLTLVRCPEGHHKECFFQKHAGKATAESIQRVQLREGKGMATYLAVDSVAGLLSLIQMGVLELHTWGSRTDKLEYPDRLVFDLDPDPLVSWERLVEAALAVRSRVETLGLQPFVKTTGGKGLHIVVPLVRKNTWDEVKEFSRAVAESLVREAPERYTAVVSKAKRKGKIFIDYLRNTRGATAVAAYSSRARQAAPVSTPIDWEELGPKLRPDSFTIRNLPHRLAGLRQDPWKGYESARRPITAAMKKALTN